MRQFLFWAFILTALPGCDGLFGLVEIQPPDPVTPDYGFNLVRGETPRTGVVFCDLEVERHCATELERDALGIRLSEAAVALNEGYSSNIALDYSPEAVNALGCVPGQPVAIVLRGKFPDGKPVCLNCEQVVGEGKVNPTPADVCRVQCYDEFLGPPDAMNVSLPVKPPTAETIDFCNTTRAHVSTNALHDACFPDACDGENALTLAFFDPRRTPEAVIWADLLPVGALTTGGAAGNDLTRVAATTNAFDAGAVSSQWFTRGDGWVEFSVAAGQTQVIGLSEIAPNCPAPCPDSDVRDVSIKFAIMVRFDGQFFVTENGQLIGPLGASVAGDRFRVRLRDNGNGTAAVHYARVPGCTPGKRCLETIFRQSPSAAAYPLRVDTSLFHQGATLTDVRVVRIK